MLGDLHVIIPVDSLSICLGMGQRRFDMTHIYTLVTCVTLVCTSWCYAFRRMQFARVAGS